MIGQIYKIDGIAKWIFNAEKESLNETKQV